MRAKTGEDLVHDVSCRLRLHGWIANSIGAAVVFAAIGFLVPIFLDVDRHELGLQNGPFVVACVAVFGATLTWVYKRDLAKALGWIEEGREPSEREYRRTLRLPKRAAVLTAIGWVLGAIASFLFNLHNTVDFALVTFASIWLGGETTSALAYLLSERTLRPITALALAARPLDRSFAPGVRDRLLFAWLLGTGVPILAVLVVGTVGLTKSGVETNYVAAACVFLAAVAMAVGLLATLISARAIADPLAAVRDALLRVTEGDFAAQVEIDDASEVGLLQAGFNRMAEGLREREQIRDLFGRQVGHEVARAALREGTRMGGEEREVGVLFVDLTGSTSMALAMPPTEVVRLLNRFFRVVIDVVERECGFINKLEGDAALCVFGAPVSSADPAGEALCAARKLAARLERDLPQIGFGIGVSAGRAVAGNIGSEQRFEYTVIGDPVNEAARLCELAKERGEHLVASEAAVRLARNGEPEFWEVSDETVLRGRLEATGVAMPRTVERPLEAAVD